MSEQAQFIFHNRGAAFHYSNEKGHHWFMEYCNDPNEAHVRSEFEDSSQVGATEEFTQVLVHRKLVYVCMKHCVT